MIAALLSLTLLAAPVDASAEGSGYYTPQEAQALFAQGNEAFGQDQYAKAREDFERLLAHGFGGPDVHYNLGTVELAQGDLGHAVLDLERAKREGGATADVEANLALARSRQLDKVIGAQADDSFAATVAEQTPTRAVGWVFLASWALGFLLLIALRLRPRGRRGLLGMLAAVSFSAAVVSGAFLGFQAYVRENHVEAVIVDKTVPARELPNETAKVTFEVHAGLEVLVGDEAEGYVRIRLPNGLEGWAPKAGLERI